MNWTKDLVLEKINERHRAGRPLSYAATVADDETLTGAARRLFGSWGIVLTGAGLDYDQVKKDARALSQETMKPSGFWSAEVVVQEIRRRQENGLPINAHAAQNDDPSLCAAATYYHGSWGKAIEAAGIEYLEHRKTQEWTPEKITERIQFAYERGADLADNTVNVLAPALYGAAHEYFGSWEKAIEAAGLDYAQVSRTVRWSKEKIIEMLQDAVKQGTPLTARQFSPSFHDAVIDIFGSWDAARAEAGYGERPWLQQDKMVRNHIREYRLKVGLSEQGLGDLVGFSHRSIGLLELSQQIDPRVSYALRLARALGCRVEDLFEI
jgi:DNA-binding XRE family transcriptional regulator